MNITSNRDFLFYVYFYIYFFIFTVCKTIEEKITVRSLRFVFFFKKRKSSLYL